MAGSGWILRPAAAADLEDIWLRGAAEWGPRQAEVYADNLFAAFDLLAEFPEIARERTELRPPVRIHPVGAHLVVYLSHGPLVEVVRVLHARQDLMAYVNEG